MDASATETAGGGVPSTVMLNRHIPRRSTAQGRRRSFNHALRASAKRIAQGQDGQACERMGLPCASEDDSLARAALRPHLEAELRRQWNASRQPPRLRCRSRPNPDLCAQDEADEGRDLAHSEVPLPSDRFRLVRRPTLEREDAFRDASTSARGKVRLRHTGGPNPDDAQIAELYSIGLLYDDKDDAAKQDGEGLNLNTIQHEQPVYSIRPDRRARRPTKAKAPGQDRPLHLDLSFSDLGEDTAIAQYLASPSGREQAVADDGALQCATRPSRQQAFPPLRVIYELAGARPTFDVETSQPPDLVTDLISDYDCFSDSELDDGVPSQREVRESGDHSTADAWVMLGDDL
ncbi:hypothetical protein CDD83_6976 [Cordyceps sp. RAO-2017]|nr:hypothetical protein CDD83_6976 [Cordyceps sp. RAO-2017]